MEWAGQRGVRVSEGEEGTYERRQQGRPNRFRCSVRTVVDVRSEVRCARSDL